MRVCRTRYCPGHSVCSYLVRDYACAAVNEITDQERHPQPALEATGMGGGSRPATCNPFVASVMFECSSLYAIPWRTSSQRGSRDHHRQTQTADYFVRSLVIGCTLAYTKASVHILTGVVTVENVRLDRSIMRTRVFGASETYSQET